MRLAMVKQCGAAQFNTLKVAGLLTCDALTWYYTTAHDRDPVRKSDMLGINLQAWRAVFYGRQLSLTTQIR